MSNVKYPYVKTIALLLLIVALCSCIITYPLQRSKENTIENSKTATWGINTSLAMLTLFKSHDKTLVQSVDLIQSDQIPGYTTVLFNRKSDTSTRRIIGAAGRWGYGSAPLGGNREEGILPDTVHLAYVDDLSNIYYISDHPLPTETIYELLNDKHKRMFDSVYDIPNYSNIELGFTPNGWVIVYVTGWAGRKEVASFQAKEIEPDPKLGTVDIITAGDNMAAITYEETINTGINTYLNWFKENNPDLYQKLQSGEWNLSSDWYKKMQTKFPWNLSVEIDGQEWNGEYYAEFANTEKFAVLDDQFDKYNTELKAVPHKIDTWVIDKETGKRTQVGVHLYPRPKWSARALRDSSYQPYYKDPNLDYFFKRFEYLYPKLSLATNNEAVSSHDFATLKLHFDKDLVLTEAYLQKGSQKLPIEGAYQFSRLPTVPEKGKYSVNLIQPHQQFITEPKREDLSDSIFADIE